MGKLTYTWREARPDDPMFQGVFVVTAARLSGPTDASTEPDDEDHDATTSMTTTAGEIGGSTVAITTMITTKGRVQP